MACLHFYDGTFFLVSLVLFLPTPPVIRVVLLHTERFAERICEGSVPRNIVISRNIKCLRFIPSFLLSLDTKSSQQKVAISRTNLELACLVF